MKCDHKNRLYQFAVIYGPTAAGVISTGNAGNTVAGQCRCEVCHEVLSLGHSDETPVAVAVEISAARWSNTPAGAYCPADVWAGHDAHRNGYDPAPWPYCPDAWAGWLAREIEQHDKEHP